MALKFEILHSTFRNLFCSRPLYVSNRTVYGGTYKSGTQIDVILNIKKCWPKNHDARKQTFEEVKKYREATEKQNFEPAKLHLVTRIGRLNGRPYWEKEVMIKLGIDGPKKKYVIVMNSPSVNKMLHTVKHLIRIRPITFPNGLPDPGDLTGTFLKHNGEFIISPKLKIDPKHLTDSPEWLENVMRRKYICERLRYQWDTDYRGFQN